jgi:hypothetical protein
VNEQLINRKDKTAPKIVKKNGIFFNEADANSASIATKCSKLVVMVFIKKGLPRPRNISLEKNPQKILPIAKTIKGIAIFIGAS